MEPKHFLPGFGLSSHPLHFSPQNYSSVHCTHCLSWEGRWVWLPPLVIPDLGRPKRKVIKASGPVWAGSTVWDSVSKQNKIQEIPKTQIPGLGIKAAHLSQSWVKGMRGHKRRRDRDALVWHLIAMLGVCSSALPIGRAQNHCKCTPAAVPTGDGDGD